MFKYKFCIICSITAIISFFFSLGYGQDQIHQFKFFSAADGLDIKTAYNFAQDKEGFIWAATGNGLYRCDGYTFKKITSPLDDYKKRIGRICELVSYDATANRLWVLSYSDIQYLDLNTYTFYRPKIKDDKNVSNEKYGFIKIDEDRIWYGGNDFIYELSLINGEINLLDKFKNYPTTASNRFVDMDDYRADEVIITGGKYILFVNKNTYEITKTIMAEKGQYFTRSTYDASRSYLWISANNALVGYDLQSNKRNLYRFTYSDEKNHTFNRIITSAVFLNGHDLLLTNDVIFNVETKKSTLVKEMVGMNSNRLKNEFSHFKDRDGNIWRGSINQGCDVLLATNTNTKVYGPLVNEKGINIEPYSSHLSTEKNKLYIAGSGISGFYSIDLNSKEKKHITNPFNLDENFIVNDIVDDNGTIYSCNSKNIFKYHNGEFKVLNPPTNSMLNSFSNTEQLSIWQKKLIACTNRELFVINPTDGQFQKWNYDEIDLEINGTHNPYFTTQLLGNDDHYYYCSNVGIYRQNSIADKPEKIKLSYKGKRIVLSTISIAQDSLGRLWLGTIDNGVWIYDLNSHDIHPLVETNNKYTLSGVNKLTILKKRAYIGSQTAILVYNTESEKFERALNRQNGFVIDDAGYEIKNQGGQFITVNTYPYVITYTPTEATSTRSKLWFTSLKISNKEKLLKPTNSLPEITLGYQDQALSIAFTDLNYFKVRNKIYKYRLKGLDEEWTVCNSNEIALFRLPSGNYDLEIAYLESIDNDKVLTSIPIKIQPPFWKMWWFISSALLFVAAMIYFWNKQKLMAYRNEMDLKTNYEKQLANLEMKALRAQMNPHFIFNSLNSIQKFIFEKDEYAASQYLTKFSRLIRHILDQSNQEHTTLSNEIDLLKLYTEMEALRFNDIFRFELTVDPSLPLDLKLPSMIIQPHIENAIWHGLLHKENGGVIKLNFIKKNDQSIEIIIEDNGIGREKANELKSKQVLKKKSYGSQISEDRVKIFNELNGVQTDVIYVDLKDDSGKARGTSVLITLAFVQ